MFSDMHNPMALSVYWNNAFFRDTCNMDNSKWPPPESKYLVLINLSVNNYWSQSAIFGPYPPLPLSASKPLQIH